MGRRVRDSFVIPSAHGRAVEVRAGQILRIVEVDGKQTADLAFFNLQNPRERYHASQTLVLNLMAGVGTLRRVKYVYSNPPYERVMLTVIDDPVGVHFVWNGGRCSRAIYRIRDGIAEGHRNCQDNLAEAVAPWGLEGDDVLDVFNTFMNVDVEAEQRLVFKPPVAEQGDYIDLRAEMDVLAAISACPSDRVATNDFAPKRIGVEIWEESRD